MSDKELIERKESSELLYRGSILDLRKDVVVLPNGKTAEREYVEHLGAAAILPIDSEGNILLVRQYRYPFKTILFEIPAGKLEKGEHPLDCAKRELREETGYVAGKMSEYGVFYPTPGYSNEKIFLYLATDLVRVESHPDEDEFLDAYRLPVEKVVQLIVSGEIQDGKTCYTVMRYAWENKIKIN